MSIFEDPEKGEYFSRRNVMDSHLYITERVNALLHLGAQFLGNSSLKIAETPDDVVHPPASVPENPTETEQVSESEVRVAL